MSVSFLTTQLDADGTSRDDDLACLLRQAHIMLARQLEQQFTAA
jgi:hypothetical protein